MRCFSFTAALAAAALLTAAQAPAQTTEITGTLTGDRYNYWIVADGGTRDRAPVFAFEQGPPPAPQFFFDYYDSQMVLQWELTIPGSLQGQALEVTSARVEVWNIQDAEWDPTSGEVHLFAAGFSGTNGFTEETWTEGTNYVGPTSSTDGARDPYPIDLVTGISATDDSNATPWSVGTPDAAYTGVPANDPDDAFLITFNLNVADSTIQTELRDDLDNGVSSWIIGSTYAAAQPPDPSFYPELITKEGVGNTTYGTSQTEPTLILEVQPFVANVSNWNLYQ